MSVDAQEKRTKRSRTLATTVIRAGHRGAETRHQAMVARLGELGFEVRVEICDIRPGEPGSNRLVPLRKFLAGVRTVRKVGSKEEAFFAFEPYSFIGGALLMRLRGHEALFFCRNDQIYQEQQIASQINRAPRVGWRQYILQYLCLVLCSAYVVQSGFAAEHLARRFRNWPLSGSAKKITILPNDLRIPVREIQIPKNCGRLRVGFVSNPVWEKKGFFILQDLLLSDAFRDADLTFTIVGKGEAFDRLLDAVAESPEGKVSFHGFCDDIAALRGLVDVVFVPSIVDHFPNVVIECAALGLPMLLSDIEAHRNILPEHPGYFDLRLSPKHLADALLAMRDPAIWTAIAESQQRHIQLLSDAWQEPLAEIFESKTRSA